MEAWLWLIVAAFALLIEIVTVGNLVSIWFVFGAALAYMARFLGLGFAYEVVFFMVGSLLSFILMRPLAKRYLSKGQSPTNADRYIGQQVRIVEAVSPDKWGAVTLQGIRWSCKEVNNQAIDVDCLVEIVALEGAKLIVKKV
jgi:membrane protein implicated in regulation of membrane protease activity